MKYYTFKAYIKEQNITLENILKIRMLINLKLIFKIFFTDINNQMPKKLKKNQILFKAIKEEKTCIKAKHKTFANFATSMIKANPRKRPVKGKKEFDK